MKSFITSLVIAAFIVAGSIAYGMHIDKVSSELVSINTRLIDTLEAEDFDGAEEVVNEVQSYFDKKRAMLGATDNHEVLDKIEINIQELCSYVEGRQKTDAISRCRVLGYLYDHLPKNYKLKFEFEEIEDGELKKYVYVKLQYGDKSEERKLSDLLNGETISFDCKVDTKKVTVIKVTYSMPSKIGNEAQKATSDFVIKLTAEQI